MSGPASNPQWYLARDGQQYGPISEAEMAKFVELGHLQPTDLLWREGFPDWRPAMVVFPPRGPGLPHGPGLGSGMGSGRGPSMGLGAGPAMGDPAHARAGGDRSPRLVAEPLAPSVDGYADDYEQPRSRRLVRVLALGVVVIALAGAAALAYPYRAQVTQLIASLTTSPGGAMAIADRKSLETPPLVGFRSGPVDAIDATLQGTALWRVIKREFPEWYAQRLNEAAALAREDKDDAVIGQLMARKLAELRRQHVANGLQATLDRLKMVAVAYLDTLSRLRAYNAEACSGFIRHGEAEPTIVGLLQGSEHTAHLQALSTAVFEAIAEGRQLPRVHPRPSQDHHAMLANDLAKRGWKQSDFQLLSSDLSQAPPDKVCQLVHDFFEAQLSLPDSDAQLRLLVDSLRPVFAS